MIIENLGPIVEFGLNIVESILNLVKSAWDYKDPIKAGKHVPAGGSLRNAKQVTLGM